MVCAVQIFIATETLWKPKTIWSNFKLLNFLLVTTAFCALPRIFVISLVFFFSQFLYIIIMCLRKGKEQILNSIFTKRILHFLFVTDSCPGTKQRIYRRYPALKEMAVLLHPWPFLSNRSREVLRIY